MSFAEARKFLWFSGDLLAVEGLVEFVIRVNQQRTAYIPKEIVEGLGCEWILVPNTRAAVIYDRRCDLDDAIRSLEVILEGLRLKLRDQRRGGSSHGL